MFKMLANVVESIDFNKNMIVQCAKKGNGLMGKQLFQMVEEAERHLKIVVDREKSTVPMYSHIFNLLMNNFVALDVLSVAVTDRDTAQFSTVLEQQLVRKNSQPFIDRFLNLQGKEIHGKVGNSIVYLNLWDIWNAIKHRGFADVDLIINDKKEA